MSIKIITDSASDITQAEAKRLNIEVVPLEVRFNEDVYKDGVDLLANDFYKKLIETDNLPKTSQINPAAWDNAFKKATQDGSDVLVITISSKLSGTYRSAVLAAQEYDDKVMVVDSLNVTVGEKILVLEAIKLLKDNLSLQELKNKIDELKKHIRVVAIVDTLKYLKKGGRISALAAVTGELLSIKPVVGIIDGEVKVIGKSRGSKNAKNYLNTLVSEHGGIDFDKSVLAVYAGFSSLGVEKYIEDSKDLYKDKLDNVEATQMGATIGTHIGPGGMGVAFFSNNKK